MNHRCPFCYEDPCGCILTEDDMKDYKIKDLEQKLVEALEVIRFYGNPLNYNLDSSVLGYQRPVNDVGEASWTDPDSDFKYSGVVGGKRARDYLEKHGIDNAAKESPGGQS